LRLRVAGFLVPFQTIVDVKLRAANALSSKADDAAMTALQS